MERGSDLYPIILNESFQFFVNILYYNYVNYGRLPGV